MQPVIVYDRLHCAHSAGRKQLLVVCSSQMTAVSFLADVRRLRRWLLSSKGCKLAVTLQAWPLQVCWPRSQLCKCIMAFPFFFQHCPISELNIQDDISTPCCLIELLLPAGVEKEEQNNHCFLHWRWLCKLVVRDIITAIQLLAIPVSHSDITTICKPSNTLFFCNNEWINVLAICVCTMRLPLCTQALTASALHALLNRLFDTYVSLCNW